MILPSAFGAVPLTIQSEWGKVTEKCKSVPDAPKIWILKQWHLSPSTDTRVLQDYSSILQTKNLTSLYLQLEKWIEASAIKQLIAEGCTGEITEASVLRFNGWKISDLKPELQAGRFSEIPTSVAMKLETKFGDAIQTLCGDDEALIKEGLLAFSDARGALGFLTRIIQNKKDKVKAQLYIDGVVKAYAMDKNTSILQAMARLKVELKKAIDRVEVSIEKRNEKVLQIVEQSKEKNLAILFGGMHAKGLQRLLEKKNYNCSVVEPTGYQDDESQLLQSLKELLAKL